METTVKTSQEVAADKVAGYIASIVKPRGPGTGVGYESAANMLIKSHRDQARVLREWRDKRAEYRDLPKWRRILVKFFSRGVISKNNF